MTPFITNDSERIRDTLIQFREKYKEALGYDSEILAAHIRNDKLGSMVF
ncbi:MAG: hypothetical protein HFH08_03680 [Bacilli bacterium]|nr:hypothetical protein [Bacilli bacterium]